MPSSWSRDDSDQILKNCRGSVRYRYRTRAWAGRL